MARRRLKPWRLFAVPLIAGAMLWLAYPRMKSVVGRGLGALSESATTAERGSETFDPSRWRTEGTSGKYRWRAVDDLQARHPLEGMPRAAVISLLGEPDGKFAAATSMAYRLAPQPLIDDWWLVLEMNDAGVVTKHSILPD
jgi:hypothetical protein